MAVSKKLIYALFWKILFFIWIKFMIAGDIRGNIFKCNKFSMCTEQYVKISCNGVQWQRNHTNSETSYIENILFILNLIIPINFFRLYSIHLDIPLIKSRHLTRQVLAKFTFFIWGSLLDVAKFHASIGIYFKQ